MNNLFRNTILVSIMIISTLMHFEHLSKDLMSIHVWRQTQTQSTINNFYEEDINIFNPTRNERGNTEGLFRMEFPIMQWLVALQYKIFGNHIIISRIFMLIIGFFSVFGLYKLLNALFNNKIIALIGAWTFNFSPSFYYYTINPLPDNLALCSSIWGLTFFFQWYESKKNYLIILSGIFLSIGALTKLPFIIYYIIPVIFFISIIIKDGLSKKVFYNAFRIFSFSILPVTWYATVIPTWDGNIIIKGIIDNKESSENLISYYNHILVSTLPELLLNYGSVLFFLAGFYFLVKNKSYRNPKFILILSLSIMVLIYYFFEANAIGKIHDYYLFPFYPLLFILVAYGANGLINKNIKLKYLSLILLILLPVSCYFRMQSRWNEEKPGFNKDLLVYKTELRNAIPKDALVVVGNDVSHFIFLYYIDKKGWGFQGDYLPINDLQKMINNGAQYIYTDSEKIGFNTEYSHFLDKLITKKGSISLYKLKQ